MQIISLVTGGAGFIGSHVVNHLIEMKHRVVVLDDLSGGLIENIHPDAEFCKGSITDTFLVDGLFETYQFDYVYHLAASAAEGLSHFIRRFNYQNNLIGSINLINASVNHNVACFVFASSIAVYGTNELPLVESQKPNPEDPYGIAKYAVEMDLQTAHELFGLNGIIFRPHNVYGSNQNIADKYRNVVGIFMNQLMQEKELTIFGDGTQTRAFSHIDDVAPYIARSVEVSEAQNQIFNIGGETPYSVKELAGEVMEAMEVKGSITYLNASNEVEHAYADHSKFKNIFNPLKTVPLKKGLKEMGNWVKNQSVVNTRAKSEPGFKSIEIEKNMPESWKNNL